MPRYHIKHFLWVLFFIFMCSTNLSPFPLDTQTFSDEGSGKGSLVVLGIGGCFASVIMWSYSTQRLQGCVQYVWRQPEILFLIIFPILSACWSDFPGLSFRRSIVSALCIMLILCYVSTLRNLELLVTNIHNSILFLIAISILGVLLIPDHAIHTRDIFVGSWRGMFGHKNYAGGLSTYGLILSLWLMRYSKQKFFYFLSSTIFLIFVWNSNSKTALFAIGLVILASSLLSAGVRLKGYFALLSISLIILCATFAYISAVYIEPKYGVNFTDRTLIWLVNWQYAKENLFFGHGFRAVYVGDNGQGISQITATFAPLNGHAHNGFLEILGQLGLVGLIGTLAVLVSLLSTSAPALRQKDKRASAFSRAAFAAIVFGLIRACFEPDILSGTRIHWLLLITLLFALSLENARVKRNK